MVFCFKDGQYGTIKLILRALAPTMETLSMENSETLVSKYPWVFSAFLFSAGVLLNAFWIFILFLSIDNLPALDSIAGFAGAVIIASKVVPNSYHLLFTAARKILVEGDQMVLSTFLGGKIVVPLEDIRSVRTKDGYWDPDNFPVAITTVVINKSRKYRIGKQMDGFQSLLEAIRKANSKCVLNIK